MNDYSKEELEHLLIFLNRADLKGSESYAWVNLVEKIKKKLSEFNNTQNVEKVNIK